MRKTFTLCSHRASDEQSFEPYLAESEADAFARAHEMLKGDGAIERVEVYFSDNLLFSVGLSKR